MKNNSNKLVEDALLEKENASLPQDQPDRFAIQRFPRIR